MRKKIIGIFVCMLFLFSTLPVVTSTKLDKNSEKSFLKSNNNIKNFEIYIEYGKVINNGLGDYGFGWFYEVIPIDVKDIYIRWDYENGFYIEKGNVSPDPIYMQVGSFLFHGFLTKNYMIFYEYDFW